MDEPGVCINRFEYFTVFKNKNRVAIRLDNIVTFGETPGGTEIVMQGMDGAVVVTESFDTVKRLFTLN